MSAYAFATSIFVASLTILATWASCRRLPKIQREKLGIAVAINCESGANPTVGVDFVRALRASIGAGGLNSRFQFEEIPEHVAQRLLNEADAARCMKKVRATYFLLGTVRSRKLNGTDHEILDVLGIVSHAPLDTERANHFAKEFAEVLPRRYQIPTADAFAQVEFTARWAALVAKYIIGIAAGISNHLDLADQLFKEVQAALTTQKQGFLFAPRLEGQVPKLREQISFLRARMAARAWYDSKSEADFARFTQWITHAKELGHDGINWQALYALHAFASSRETAVARQALETVPASSRDAVWNLNMAFLEGYDGNLKKAGRFYHRAAEIGVPVDAVDITVGQVEHFLVWQLEIEPSKYEMHYCLGCLNRDLKGDVEQARADFQAFLKACPPDRHLNEQDVVKRWIDELVVIKD